LRAHDSDSRYLIEVKTRTDDETLTEELREHGSAYRVSPLGPTNAVSGILQHAATQLNGLLSTGEFRLVWFRVRSRRGEEETLAERVRHTLYGISPVAGTGRGSKAPPCYFFHESTFFRYQELDGSVIDYRDRLLLCLNPYSKHSRELRASRLG